MKDFVLNIKENFINKKTCCLLLSTFIFGIIIYIVLITNSLTNQSDALWVGDYYYAFDNELVCGRWLWIIFDKFLQGLKIEPIVSCLALMFFALGNVIVIKELNIKNEIFKYLTSFAILATTACCCQMSFKHQSYIFGLSYFLAAISFYSFTEITNKSLSTIMSSFFMILCLASYQSEIGCFCLFIILYLVVKLLNSEIDFNSLLNIVLRTIIVIIISCIIYKITWDLFIKVYDIEMFSYKGNDNLSIINMIINLPKNILQTYKYFYQYLIATKNINIYLNSCINIFLICFLFCFINLILEKNKNFILIIILILLVPLACNLTTFFANAGMTLQQSLPNAIFYILIVPVLFDYGVKNHNFNIFYKTVLSILMIVILFGNIISTEIDIEAIREGWASSKSIMNSVCADLVNSNVDTSKMYFIGTIYGNDYFKVTNIFERANSYARFGDFYKDIFSLPASYQGLINQLGYNVKCNYSSNNDLLELFNNPDVKEMPTYPHKGYYKEINGYVVVKISNDY